MKKYGDKWTLDFVSNLSKKAKKLFFIEFAALNNKYTYENFLFYDNEEKSIIKYAYSWLGSLKDFSINYVGKTPMGKHEPYRFMFVCKRKLT
jgi:hypothetical protein